MVGDQPRATKSISAEFQIPARKINMAERLLASAEWPGVSRRQDLSFVSSRPRTFDSIVLPAITKANLVTLTTPEPRRGAPLIVAIQPSLGDRQPGGAESPKLHGGGVDLPKGSGGNATSGGSNGSPLASTPYLSLSGSGAPGQPTRVAASAVSPNVKAATPAPNPASTPIANSLVASPNTSGNIDFPTPTAGSVPRGITDGPDGNIWFTEYQTNQIGKLDLQTGVITEYAVPTAGAAPLSIVTGPNGNLWFSEWQGRKIGEINPATGAITESALLPGNGHPYGITVGTNGEIWFGEALSGEVGEIDPTSLAITQFAVPTNSDNVGIASGSDGNMWFAEGVANKIAKINPTTGTVTEYTIPTAGSYPLAIIAGPDGALWFAEYYGNKIGRIDTSGHISEFAIPTSNSRVDLFGLTERADGGIWIAEQGTDKIGRIDTATDSIVEYAEPTSGNHPEGITVGADNALWYTDYSGNAISRYYPTLIGAGSPSPISTTANQNFSGQVAAFHDGYNQTTDTNLQAEIEWGDGQTSEGTIDTDGSGNYVVTGSNTYAEGGTNPITVTLLDGDTEEDISDGDPNGFQIDNTAIVADAGQLAVYSPISASFVGTDTTTQGNWPGTYGSAGYDVAGGSESLPSYASVAVDANYYTWNGNTTDVRAPLTAPGSTSRIAACWCDSITVDVNLTDGQAHDVSLYLLDWDDSGRSERVDVVDPATNNVLDSRTASSFSGGDYLTWTLTGHVQLRFTALASNVVLSGIFIQPPSGNYIAASDAAPFDGLVSRFTDSDPNATPDKYTTSIDFGDGEGVQEGYVVADPNVMGVFDIYGDHDFFSAGTDAGTATITETGGTTLAMNFTTIVAEANPVAVADVPTIKITSRGSHTGDGTTITDIEGMKYTVGQSVSFPAGNDTNATKYSLVSINWTYPTSSVKGYGRFSPIPPRNPSGTVKFIGDPDAARDTTVTFQTFTDGDQSKSLLPGGSANFIDSFYWGPTAQGLQTISVTAIFNVIVNGVKQAQQFSTGDNVQVNVLRPSGSINVTTFGTPGNGGKLNQLPRMGLDKNTVAENKVIKNGVLGIQYTANITAASTNGLGAFSTVQTVSLNESFSFTDKTNNTVNATFGLPDLTSPIALDTASDQTCLYTAGAPVGNPITADDSPGVQLRTFGRNDYIYREDHFETTLVYVPDQSGIMIPVGSIQWGWSGNSSYDATRGWLPGTFERWPDTGNPTYVAASSNNDFPTWFVNVNQFVPKIVPPK